MAKIPDEILAAMAANPSIPNPDRLEDLRKLVARARDLELTKKELEERLEEVKSALYGREGLYHKLMPEMMDDIGVAKIALAAEGNLPAVEAKTQPFYAASIPTGWPAEQRQDAFDYLDSTGHGDLIKTEVTLAFPREQRARALEFVKLAKKFGSPDMKENVHHMTLTAWLREQVEIKRVIPDLEKIGGTIARIVKLKTLKPF